MFVILLERHDENRLVLDYLYNTYGNLGIRRRLFEHCESPSLATGRKGEQSEMGRGGTIAHPPWTKLIVFSHDILHLLTDLPSGSSSRVQRTTSPGPSPTSSWASLPSDLEETFQMSDPDEIAEYERTKRLSRIASLREARLKEREEEDRLVEKESQVAVQAWPEEEIVRPPRMEGCALIYSLLTQLLL